MMEFQAWRSAIVAGIFATPLTLPKVSEISHVEKMIVNSKAMHYLAMVKAHFLPHLRAIALGKCSLADQVHFLTDQCQGDCSTRRVNQN